MKILLIQPSQKSVYGVVVKPSYVPLGLLYIGASLEKASYVVVGEGEETIVELVKALGNGHGLSEIKGIYYKDKNKFVFTGGRTLIENLDNIPFPARHLLKHPFDYIPPGCTRNTGSFYNDQQGLCWTM